MQNPISSVIYVYKLGLWLNEFDIIITLCYEIWCVRVILLKRKYLILLKEECRDFSTVNYIDSKCMCIKYMAKY